MSHREVSGTIMQFCYILFIFFTFKFVKQGFPGVWDLFVVIREPVFARWTPLMVLAGPGIHSGLDIRYPVSMIHDTEYGYRIRHLIMILISVPRKSTDIELYGYQDPSGYPILKVFSNRFLDGTSKHILYFEIKCVPYFYDNPVKGLWVMFLLSFTHAHFRLNSVLHCV